MEGAEQIAQGIPAAPMSNPITRLLFDPVDPDREAVPRRYQFDGASRWWMIPLALGIALVAVSVVAGGAVAGSTKTLFAYLIAWSFCVSIALGATFFVMIQHVTRAKWSTTIRRIPEAIMASFPLLALAGIPILLGMHDLFHWSHAELYVKDTAYFDSILYGKAGYFFWPMAKGGFPLFFVARFIGYFLVWTWLGTKLYRASVQNDTSPSVENTHFLYKWSARGIPIMAVTTAFASYDFIMSTDPHWFSTMFGVYFFAGGWLAALCLITFLALLLKKGGMLNQEVTTEHIQDMGKFMFAFVVFWTYIAFSQYMLYWYANLPEETVWYWKRFTGGWGIVAAALFIFHFLLPFLILIFRSSKRIYPVIATMAVWLLVMHWVDLWWMTMPAMLPEAAAGHASAMLSDGGAFLASLQTMPDAMPDAAAVPMSELHLERVEATVPALEFGMWLGMCGLFIGSILLRLSRHALTPYADPYFADSLKFENV
ncbi:MAG: hypothetical protein Rubg2KO_00820 [Rubricoccaceae bacterium]